MQSTALHVGVFFYSVTTGLHSIYAAKTTEQ